MSTTLGNRQPMTPNPYRRWRCPCARTTWVGDATPTTVCSCCGYEPAPELPPPEDDYSLVTRARSESGAQICIDASDLNQDEREVVTEAVRLMLEGVRAGRAEHGPLCLATDKRDTATEAMHELRDGLWYLAMHRVRARGAAA